MRAPDDARITGDRDEIVQVIQNLMDNAIKYSAAGGTVELTVRGGLEAEAAAGRATGRGDPAVADRRPIATTASDTLSSPCAITGRAWRANTCRD